MTGGEQIAGVSTCGRPRTTRPVEYEPAPDRCVCGTDLEVTQSCPQNCLTREDTNR